MPWLITRSMLFVRIWSWLAIITILLRRRPLPLVVRQLSVDRSRRDPIPVKRLSHAVGRSLSIFGYQPRCLTASLVLYRLLREQGATPTLVIGLPMEPPDHTAHAWIEIDGSDVGPSPGRQGHAELARYDGAPGPMESHGG